MRCVAVVELVVPSKRNRVSSWLTIMWLTGPFVVAGLSFLVGDWRLLQLASSAPMVLVIGYWW